MIQQKGGLDVVLIVNAKEVKDKQDMKDSDHHTEVMNDRHSKHDR